jgi:plastocyanin
MTLVAALATMKRPATRGPTGWLRSVAGMALCVALAGCGSASPAKVPAGPVVALNISNFVYSPNPLTVAPAAVISVTNKDDTAHTVTAYDSAFSTGAIAPRTTVTFVAPASPGTYRFFCVIHPKMIATLIVG